MFTKILSGYVLRDFLKISLTSGERIVAEDSIKNKYALALKRSFFYCLLSVFPIVFLETQVLISVLIPITMVAGTAWFSISLANMKQKFENFGLQLTTNLFEAFSISLGLLFMLSAFSLGKVYIDPFIFRFQDSQIIILFSFILGVSIVGNIIYKIFIGSIKYDINDAMLTGQNEAAERFFRKSLSLLHSLSNSLRGGGSLQVSNYYIGVAFFEIFSFIQNLTIEGIDTETLKKSANQLIKKPAMTQQKADDLAIKLISQFLLYCVNPLGNDSKKSIEAITDEMDSVQLNPDEDQEMKDTRLGIIFAEIANLLESQGETLFKK